MSIIGRITHWSSPWILTSNGTWKYGSKLGFKKDMFFFQISDPGYPDPMEPSWLPRIAWKEHKKEHVVPKMEINLRASSQNTWTLNNLQVWRWRGCLFSFFKFPEIPKENGDLVSWEPPHYNKLFWNKNMLSCDIHQRCPPQRLKHWGWKTILSFWGARPPGRCYLESWGVYSFNARFALSRSLDY